MHKAQGILITYVHTHCGGWGRDSYENKYKFEILLTVVSGEKVTVIRKRSLTEENKQVESETFTWHFGWAVELRDKDDFGDDDYTSISTSVSSLEIPDDLFAEITAAKTTIDTTISQF